jgi:hypothetical protein
MRLLVVAPYCIVPAETGGPIRVNELARGVSAWGIAVTVAMPITFKQPLRMRINDHLMLRVIPYPFLLPLLLTNKPFCYNYLMSLHPGYGTLLKRTIKNNDIIQFEGASFGDLVNSVPRDKIVVYNAHNVEADYETGESRVKWARSISVKRIRLLEEKLTRRADLILTCSQQDSERLSKFYKIAIDKCMVIPNGIHLHRTTTPLTRLHIMQKFPGLLDFPQRAIFTGSNVAHNREAVRFILESLAPALRAKCAFLIKGQCGRPFRHRMPDNVFYDPVPGTAGPYAGVCTVALNPVTLGSGTSLKVLDYLVHHIPVLSTKFGMRGFEDLMDFATVSYPEDFITHLRSEFITQPPKIEALEKYDWKTISKKLKNVYHSLVEDRVPCA